MAIPVGHYPNFDVVGVVIQESQLGGHMVADVLPATHCIAKRTRCNSVREPIHNFSTKDFHSRAGRFLGDYMGIFLQRFISVRTQRAPRA